MTAFDDAAHEAEVDRLYQLPLDEFIEARTELAKRLGGTGARFVRALSKPNLLAWALNQLYWSKRKTFDRLVAAAAQLRTAQADALLGRRADLRGAGDVHRDAIREALREATAVLRESGHEVTPDAIRELTGALEALPWKDRAGRLERPPAASGFDALAGMPIGVAPARPATRGPDKADRGPGPIATKGRAAPGRRGARGIQQAALKAAQAAATAARREESQAASRAARADKQVGAAAKREEEARQALADAERDRARAEEEKRAANAALDEARRAVMESARRLAEADEKA